jgi:hypothetical protein
MAIIFNIEESVKNSAFNILQEPIKFLLQNEVERFEQDSIIPKVYVMKTTDKFQEEFRTVTGMDGFEPTEDMEVAGLTDFEESYNKIWRTQIWTNSYVISKQTIEDNNIGQIEPNAIGFIKTYGRTREAYGVAVLGAGLGTVTEFGTKKKIALNGKGSDTIDGSIDGTKQQYFHNAHKTVALKDGRAPIEQSNKFHAAIDFSGADKGYENKVIDVIEQVASRMKLYKGDKGEILAVNPTVLIVPENYRLLDAIQRGFKGKYGDGVPVGTGKTGIKYGAFTIYTSPYLSAVSGFGDSDYGFLLLDPERNREGMGAVWYDRVPLSVRSYIDNNTEANVWAGRARFGAGFGDFRAISYISLAASAPANSTTITPLLTGITPVEVLNDELNPVLTQRIEPSLGLVTITSEYGGEANKSTITITSDKKKPNNKFYYKAHASAVAAPKYGDDTTGWTEMTLVANAQTIEFTTETKIRVAEVNVAGEIIKVSEETTIVNSEA